MMQECLCCSSSYFSKDPRGSKFCSLSCSTHYRESNRAVKFKFCRQCNKSFKSQGGWANQKQFCGHSCAASFHNKNKATVKKLKPVRLTKEEKQNLIVVGWLSGSEVGHTKYASIRDPIRRYLFSESCNKCSNCGFSGVNPITGKTILQIDHIDGDCFNSSKSNLRVLCPNCHSMTDTYGSLNKKSGRSWKRHQYKKKN